MESFDWALGLDSRNSRGTGPSESVIPRALKFSFDQRLAPPFYARCTVSHSTISYNARKELTVSYNHQRASGIPSTA